MIQEKYSSFPGTVSDVFFLACSSETFVIHSAYFFLNQKHEKPKLQSCFGFSIILPQLYFKTQANFLTAKLKSLKQHSMFEMHAFQIRPHHYSYGNVLYSSKTGNIQPCMISMAFTEYSDTKLQRDPDLCSYALQVTLYPQTLSLSVQRKKRAEEIEEDKCNTVLHGLFLYLDIFCK